MQFAAKVLDEPPVSLADEIHRRQRRQSKRRRRFAREQSDVRVDEGLLAGVQIEAEGAGGQFAIEQRVDHDVRSGRIRRLDPEFAKKRELLVEARGGADRKAPRRQAVTLAAAEETEVTRSEKRDHFVPDMGRIDRKT